ncbi:hypothetical protein BDV41DRAFT_574914 [Aspergillus transmontanensis]|uniref:Uncharacterized protein n=1 Tax=Aspergillus transmontanensis TaxID=1034304 RepID=A0A5N6W353_9EURO|nr:hypothetical protein BDV41DRAFT_574914 [Aspergillus transmontanensis]
MMDLFCESIPDEWTTDPAEIHLDLVWKGENSQGQRMARRFGLLNPQVVMTSKRETGIPQYMFQSGKRCYIWNEMSDTVWQITKPVVLMAILRTMVTKGEKALKVKEVEPVEVYKIEDDNEGMIAHSIRR